MVQKCQVPEIMERTLMMDDLAIIDLLYSHVIAHPNSELVSKETYKFIFSRKGKYLFIWRYIKLFLTPKQLIGVEPSATTEPCGKPEFQTTWSVN